MQEVASPTWLKKSQVPDALFYCLQQYLLDGKNHTASPAQPWAVVDATPKI
ncbi:hypothetical protein HanXRQr2_Chr12g0555771 [Helianthus annuus]|uniref:Uncharacterized protein n=1 Tax=Helianthus annuus TaxID=4232 RepID=A0A251T5I1_HELAN|nr:hypothetical protein HanXRQr2_Chr12g0555771 [Helianthus annuus]KAJ0863874.1 hypothetical protein HanPSC8_Chr12g0535071 [Helianthus annuus]